MQIEEINTQEDYEDFCTYMENGKYDKVEIGDVYVITDDIKFVFADKFKYAVQDTLEFITGTFTPPKEQSKETVKKTSKVKEIQKIEFIPTKIVTVSGISFNIL